MLYSFKTDSSDFKGTFVTNYHSKYLPGDRILNQKPKFERKFFSIIDWSETDWFN